MLRSIAIAILFSSIGIAVHAQEASGARAGLIYGFSVPDSDNTKPRNIWGVTGSTMVSKTWSMGGYYLLADKEVGTGGRQFEYSIHGLSLEYHTFVGKGDTFYGAKAGLTKITTNSSGTEVIFSPYHMGFSAGYDYNVTPWFCMGFEGNYLHYYASETSVSGTTYQEDSFNTISFVISTKILF